MACDYKALIQLEYPMIDLVLALVLAPVVAHETPAPAATPAPQRKICKVQEATSSRLGAKRICRTEAEWKVEEKAVSRDLEKRR